MQWWHFAVLILPILPNLYSIWHIRKHYFQSEQEKSLWFMLAVFVPVFGGIGYLLFGLKKARKTPLQEIENECTQTKVP